MNSKKRFNKYYLLHNPKNNPIENQKNETQEKTSEPSSLINYIVLLGILAMAINLLIVPWAKNQKEEMLIQNYENQDYTVIDLSISQNGIRTLEVEKDGEYFQIQYRLGSPLTKNISIIEKTEIFLEK